MSKLTLNENAKSGCGKCGGKLATIRGKHPGDDDRAVCPTCLKEKLEAIHDMTSPFCGVAHTVEANP